MPKKPNKPYWVKYRWAAWPKWLWTNRYKTEKAWNEGIKSLKRNGHVIVDSNVSVNNINANNA